MSAVFPTNTPDLVPWNVAGEGWMFAMECKARISLSEKDVRLAETPAACEQVVRKNAAQEYWRLSKLLDERAAELLK